MEWLSKPQPRTAESGWSGEEGGAPHAATAAAAAQHPGGYARPARPHQRPAFAAEQHHAAPLLQLQPGDSVRHKAFGQGMVLSVRPMGGDALIEVAFDKVGTKKLMLKAAGAHLTKL